METTKVYMVMSMVTKVKVMGIDIELKNATDKGSVGVFPAFDTNKNAKAFASDMPGNPGIREVELVNKEEANG